MLRRVRRVVALAAVGLVLLADPAGADPPAPGDYTSWVTSVDPPADGIDVEVVGGDSFLQLAVEPGVEVLVLGYVEEPFLRVLDDGTVERNRRSPATYLNDDRYGRADVPADLADRTDDEIAALEPDWERVAGDGEYAWHDHRIHWMAPNAPPSVERGGTFGWNGTVPIIVDGERIEVAGTIRYHHDVNPLPWLAGGVVVAVAGALLLRQRITVVTILTAVVGAAAIVVAFATFSAAPAGAGVSPLPLAAAAVGTGAAIAALRLSGQGRVVALLAAAAVLGTWGVLRFRVLTEPVLPTDLPGGVDRAVTVTAIALAVVAATAATARRDPSRD